MPSFVDLTPRQVEEFAQAVSDASSDIADRLGITGGLSTSRFNIYSAIINAILDEWDRLHPEEDRR